MSRDLPPRPVSRDASGLSSRPLCPGTESESISVSMCDFYSSTLFVKHSGKIVCEFGTAEFKMAVAFRLARMLSDRAGFGVPVVFSRFMAEIKDLYVRANYICFSLRFIAIATKKVIKSFKLRLEGELQNVFSAEESTAWNADLRVKLHGILTTYHLDVADVTGDFFSAFDGGEARTSFLSCVEKVFFRGFNEKFDSVLENDVVTIILAARDRVDPDLLKMRGFEMRVASFAHDLWKLVLYNLDKCAPSFAQFREVDIPQVLARSRRGT